MSVTPELRAQADTLRASGASFRKIEAATGISRGTLAYWYSERTQQSKRDREAAKRRDNVARGLTVKGTPRKTRRYAKPKPHQSISIHSKPKAKTERKAKVETAEQRRERGRRLRSSPLALDIEESVRRRIEEMEAA